ncbi:calcium-binding protein [Arenibaculum pallidiluteum]|uniref:hypothetical protein n=1 Tax=Arenibaculum pallidiluteum TaxID=2812559 RepID=UPI001A9616F1|nr:hypothetical protein [Arenibaculum pallidiluteum]
MSSASDVKISWGQKGGPGQWYLPGTDVSRFPDLPAGGSDHWPSVDSFSWSVNGSRLGLDGLRYAGKLGISARETVLADGSTGIHRSFESTGGWGALKNLSVTTRADAQLTVRDIVHVDVRTSGIWDRDPDGIGSTIEILGAKRGNVVTGADNDTILIQPVSNGKFWNNEFRISSGGGSDTIIVRTPADAEPQTYRGKPLVTDGHLTTVHVDAGAGNDIIHPGGAREIIDGAAGTRDTVIYDGASEGIVAFLNEVGVKQPLVGRGGAQGDVLIGVERLAGSPFDDVLYGSSGDNDLIGGRGEDLLYGGAGHDHFVLALGHGNDFVADFERGEDTVEIRGVGIVDIRQELTTVHGVEGLAIHLAAGAGEGASSLFLAGVEAELTAFADVGGDTNWHDGLMLS